jgi:hypothetical protein
MKRDPLTTWKDGFPYDILAKTGITPDSDSTAVLNASFDLMAKGLLTGEVQDAWDILRSADRRLFVDFFLYSMESSTASEGIDQSSGSSTRQAEHRDADDEGLDGLDFDR